MRNRWPRDAGMRLDHLLLSSETAKRLIASGVDRDLRGQKDASDHVPAWVILRDAPARRSAAKRTPSPKTPSPKKTPPTKTPAAKKSPRASTPRSKSAAPQRPLLVVDGDSFAHRSYHALPKTIMRSDGMPTGALLGFANFLLRIYQAERPRAVLVAWDTLSAPTYRTAKYPPYQSGREFDDALITQLGLLPDFVSACGFANAKAAGYEADDFLAAAAKAEERRGGTALIASGDRDTFQLASASTTILFPVRAGEMARIGPDEVRARYGVDPQQVPDFIAVRGDPSDKLPGVPGVGAQGAATLIRKYGSLEAALAAGRFPDFADRLRLFRSIATMDAKAPLPRLTNQKPTWSKAAALAHEWELNKLAERLDVLRD